MYWTQIFLYTGGGNSSCSVMYGGKSHRQVVGVQYEPLEKLANNNHYTLHTVHYIRRGAGCNQVIYAVAN